MSVSKKFLTIEDCRTYLIDLPLKTKNKHGPKAPFPFGIAYGQVVGLKRVLIELAGRRHDSISVKGFGEASPLYPYSNETALSVWELLTYYFSKYLRGQNLSLENRYAAKADINRILERTEKYLCHQRLNLTQAAIDFALHDIAGKALGIPTYALLTDSPHFEPVKACWSTSSNASIERNIQEARHYLNRGYAIKIKLNGNPEEDAKRTVSIIKSLEGKSASIRADANSGFSPATYMIYAGSVLSSIELNILEQVNFYVEEPIETRDFGKQEFIRLLSVSPFRLMADETLYTLEDARFLVEESRKANSVEKILFNIKVQKVGGLKNAMQVATLARENHIPIMIGGMFPSSYGKLANCHFAIAVGNVLDSDGVHPSRDYIDEKKTLIQNLDELEQMEKGQRVLKVFKTRPGFGASVDMALAEKIEIKIKLSGYYPDLRKFKI
jgi:L-alanine-DL-glutamate epimerase-like enolase superfamily enzyme